MHHANFPAKLSKSSNKSNNSGGGNIKSNNDRPMPPNNKSSNQVTPVDFILKTMVERDPKKRKVKPNAKGHDLLYLDLLNDTSSDDEEYLPKSKEIAEAEVDDDVDDDDDDDDGDDSDEDEDEEDEEDKANHKTSVEKSGSLSDILHSKEDGLKGSNDFSSVKFDLPTKVTKLLVCSVCLGDVSHEADEIVECDSCGITVHEACYGVTSDNENDNDSIHSNASSSSTEPWFCDACLANVTSPTCDLCPNTGGIFKQTDAKRWVHLVCALYIPGVAFADTSRLTGVTLFELPYDRWGAKACSLCEDERLARTGICISCDAGMCKVFFHVTCAQSHGLLSEAQTTEETELVDPFYAHCKLHAGEKSAVKSKRRNFLALQSKMKIKRQQTGNTINERIMRKLDKARLKWSKCDENRHPLWIPNQKIPRLLITSPSAVRKLIRKAELLGMSPQTQYIAAQDLDIRKKWYIPPAFSVEFVSYYLDRNSRVNSMTKRLEELKSQCHQLKGVENATRQRYEELTKTINAIKSKNSELKTTGRNIWSLLGSISREKVTIPKFLEANEEKVKEEKASQDGDKIGVSSASRSAPTSVIIKCGICHRSHDFQKLALCDSCKIHYHLYCLDPPLKRMPKKTRFGGWQCSDCTEKEDEEAAGTQTNSEEEQSRESFDDTPNKRRKLRGHVKGPNKFIPDADTIFPSNVAPAKKKKSSSKKKKKSKTVAKDPRPLLKSDSFDEGNESQNLDYSRLNRSSITTGSSNNSLLVTLEPVKKIIKLEEECCKCNSISSTKKLVQCDQCLLFYHFGCLNPPVRKNPKQKGYQWFCEECDADNESEFSDAEAEENEDHPQEDVDGEDEQSEREDNQLEDKHLQYHRHHQQPQLPLQQQPQLPLQQQLQLNQQHQATNNRDCEPRSKENGQSSRSSKDDES